MYFKGEDQKQNAKEYILKGAKILLVDDEVDFTDNMTKVLETRGYHVTSVNSGDSAIKALNQDKFDVMVLDLKMPGMDGITTLREIKKLQLSVETLILTGHGAIDTALEAMKLGAYDYLTKPCEVDELTEKLEGAWKKNSGNDKKQSVLRALIESIRKK